MFGNNYTNPYQFNSTPTATQPYGYPINNFNTNTQVPYTNKIYVNGIEDVRNKSLPFGSDYIFLDNDKPILYQKIVSNNGQFDVKQFKIVPLETQPQSNSVDLSEYVKLSDLDPIISKLKNIEDRLNPKTDNTQHS